MEQIKNRKEIEEKEKNPPWFIRIGSFGGVLTQGSKNRERHQTQDTDIKKLLTLHADGDGHTL